MPTLAYHEAIPGHHFQIAIQQEIKGPMFRKMPLFTAYTVFRLKFPELFHAEHEKLNRVLGWKK